MSRRPPRRRPALEIFGASGDRPIVSGGQNHYLRGSSYALRRREAGLSRQSQRRQRELNNQIKLIKELQKQLQEAKQSNDPRKLARLEQKLKECEARRTADQSQLKKLGDMIAECEQQRQEIEDIARGERKEHMVEQKRSDNEISSLETDNKQLTEALERCEAEKQEVEALRKQLNEAIADKDFADVTAQDEIDKRTKCEKELQSLRRTSGSSPLKMKLQMCNRDLSEEKERNNVLKDLLSREQQEARALREENDNFKKRLTAGMKSDDPDDCDELKRDFAKLEEEHVSLGEKYETLMTTKRKDIDQLGKVNENLLNRNRSLEATHTTQMKEMGELRKQIKSMNKSLTFYKGIERDLNNQIKACLASKSESKTADDPVVSDLRDQLLLAKQSLEDCRNRLQQTTDEHSKERGTKDLLSQVVTSKLQNAEKERDEALRKLADCNPEEMRKLRIEKAQLNTYLANFRKVSEDIVAMQRKAEADKDQALRDLAARRNSGESKEGAEVTRLQAKLAQMQSVLHSWSTLADDVVKARNEAEADKNQAHEKLGKCEEYADKLLKELDQTIDAYAEAEEYNEDIIQALRTKLAACQEKLRQCEAGLHGGESKKNTKPPIPSKKTDPIPVVFPTVPAVPGVVPSAPPALTEDQKVKLIILRNRIFNLLRWYAIFDPEQTQLYRIPAEITWVFEETELRQDPPYPKKAENYHMQYRRVLFPKLKEIFRDVMRVVGGNPVWPPEDAAPISRISRAITVITTAFTPYDYASDIESILRRFDEVFRDLDEQSLVELLKSEIGTDQYSRVTMTSKIAIAVDPVPVLPGPPTPGPSAPIITPEPSPPPSPGPPTPPPPSPTPPAPAPTEDDRGYPVNLLQRFPGFRRAVAERAWDRVYDTLDDLASKLSSSDDLRYIINRTGNKPEAVLLANKVRGVEVGKKDTVADLLKKIIASIPLEDVQRRNATKRKKRLKYNASKLGFQPVLKF